MSRDVDTNIDRALCLSHTFHLVVGAGRAALFPFLSLYLRLLGLSGTQTGLLLGARAFISACSAPVWTACAKGFNKKRIVLLLSLFTSMSMYLFICLIPPVDPRIPLMFCGIGLKNGSELLDRPAFHGTVNTSVSSSPHGNLTGSTGAIVDVTRLPNGTRPASAWPSSATSSMKPSSTSTTTTSSTSTTTATTTTTTTSATTTTTAASTTTTTTRSRTAVEDNRRHHASGTSSETNRQELVDLLQNLLPGEDFSRFSAEELESLARELIQTAADESPSRHRRNVLEDVRSKWHDISVRFDLAEYQTFVFLLVVVIIGELLASPSDKLADDCWFEYLDILDCLEKYGGHRLWRTVGYVVVPTMVTALVDHTACLLPLGINHFLIHFFVFAVLMAVAFLLGLCYPVSQHKQTPKRTRLSKGLRVLCADVHAFSMTFTMVVVGAASSVASIFLFWRVQDVGGVELVMGVAIAASAGAQFVIRLIHQGLVVRLTPVGTISLGLLLYGGMLVFYAFLWSPWLVVAGEVFHGLSLTLIWSALQGYPDFRINPFVMDRSGFALVNFLFTGVGMAAGSMAAGILYDQLGHMVLFLGAGGLVFVWMVMFVVLQKLVSKKKKVRYAKLLQDENPDDSDESVVYEDDWLEVAMKRDR